MSVAKVKKSREDKLRSDIARVGDALKALQLAVNAARPIPPVKETVDKQIRELSSALARAEALGLRPTLVIPPLNPVGESEGKKVKGIEVAGSSEAHVKFTAKKKGPASRRSSVTSATSRGSRTSRRSESSVRSVLKKGGKKKKAGKAESGIVGMSAAPSDYLGTGSSLLQGRGIVEGYIEQLVNPWTGGSLTRIPDNNMRPTALARFFANRTYTIPSTSNGTNFLFGMHSRLSNYATNGPYELDNTTSTAGAAVVHPVVYSYSPGNILQMMQFADAGFDAAGFPVHGASSGPWSDDFGVEQLETAQWIAAYRCLAGAMRVRVVGLPSGQFMTPGKIYFGQIRWNYDDVPSTEQDWTQLERLGYATHVSLDAVREAGSKTFYLLPDGSDKFELTSNLWPAPGIIGTSEVLPAQDVQSIRKFLSWGDSLSGQYGRQIVPYRTAANTNSIAGTQDNVDQQVADQTMLMLVAVFGTQAGVVLEVDYAQIHEYVATPAAPPGVDTAIQLPSSTAMDQIFSSSAVIGEMRGAMLQSSGDKTILSVPQKAFGPDHAEAAMVGRRTRDTLISATRRAAGGTLKKSRGRGEGFWDFDWLKKGNLGGLSWDFSDEKKKSKHAS